MENAVQNSSIEVIINAGSGADDKDETIEKLKDIFAANRIEARFLLAHGGEELLAMAKRAAEGNAQIVIAAGGDGTVSAVAAALVGTNKTLGVLPLGTLNHFAKDLGISFDLADAVSVIAAGRTTEIDVAAVNERIFINNSSIGLYPQIVRRRELQQQRFGRNKWYAAFWATIAVLQRHALFAVKIKTEAEELTRRTPFVFVGNNEYEIDILNIGARKNLSDGRLSVYLLHRTRRFDLIWLALRTITGTLKQAKDFEALSTAELIIETRRKKNRILVAVDGEVAMMDAPLRYSIRPKALKVIVAEPTENSSASF